MNKRAFLDALQQLLTGLPEDDVAQSLEYYDEMLDDCIEDGLTEPEIIDRIGTPEEIAEQIRMEMPLPTLVRARAKSRHRSAWEIVLLILGSPVWLPILLAVVIVLLSVYIVLWAIILTFYAVAVSLAAAFLGALGLSIWTLHEGDVLHGTFVLGASLVCASLSILIFLLSKGLSKASVRGTASFVRYLKKRIVGKGNAS